MKNRGIIILLICLSLIIIGVVAFDYISKRPDRSPENPYAINIDEYIQDDTSLIMYNEVRNIRLDTALIRGIAYHDNKIYILGNDFLQAISPEGRELMRVTIPLSPGCIALSESKIFIGYNDHISAFNKNGELISAWDTIGKKSVLTSLAVTDGNLFAADAGNRRVLRYTTDGNLMGQFEGKSDTGQLHGFIIPSANFDLAVNHDGELWVVNPGKHALEQYTYEGRMIGFWENASFNIDGFSGCCNPAQMAVLPDGSFVTSEKGIVRIKVHKPSGEMLCIVAPTKSFGNAFLAPDIAITPEGVILALDFDNHMVRVYQHK